MGIFGQNCEFVAKNPLFSLISCEKKLKILYSLRKKVGKWAERGLEMQFVDAKITSTIMRDRYQKTYLDDKQKDPLWIERGT